MPDEIKQVVSVEDQATAKLNAISNAEGKLADSTRKAGDAAERASHDTRKLSQANDQQAASAKKAGDELDDVAGAMSKFTAHAAPAVAAIGLIVSALQEYINKLREAAGAAKELFPDQFQGIAGNIGGQLGDEAFNITGAIAKKEGLDVAGLQKLQGFIGGITDVRDMKDPLLDKPTLDELKDPNFLFKQVNRRAKYQEELIRLSALGGELQAATSGQFAGPEAASLLQLTKEKFKIADEQAVSVLAGLGTSGYSMADSRAFIEKSGDLKLLGVAMAARDQGVRGTAAAKQFNVMLDQLNRVDETGQIAPELEAIGITPQMGGYERIKRAFDAEARGEIDDAQLRKLTGGQGTDALRRAVGPALGDPQRVDREVEGLLSPTVAADAIAAQRQSKFVRAKIAENRREVGAFLKKAKDATEIQAQLLKQREYERENNNEFLPQLPLINVGLKDVDDAMTLAFDEEDEFNAKQGDAYQVEEALRLMGDSRVKQTNPFASPVQNERNRRETQSHVNQFITKYINPIFHAEDPKIAPPPGRELK